MPRDDQQEDRPSDATVPSPSQERQQQGCIQSYRALLHENYRNPKQEKRPCAILPLPRALSQLQILYLKRVKCGKQHLTRDCNPVWCRGQPVPGHHLGRMRQ
ncbi:hypothetical protein TNIN_260191 [Trichonephila inaurata madagascariensis]|uniref:Uncharacterized protein n=1 Tax=Trichonephila inaurata madagascariensis TaxID=2747483 RepID=A0A8X6YC59_9ARAC|nr:hypothetical protein TNIN_260191 [Trichonephila inaurata madagascariensis]